MVVATIGPHRMPIRPRYPLPDALADSFPALRAGAHGYLLKDQALEQLIAQLRGTSIAKIGAAMGISRHTVGDPVKDLYRKLKISSHVEAALQVRSLGLMQTGRE